MRLSLSRKGALFPSCNTQFIAHVGCLQMLLLSAPALDLSGRWGMCRRVCMSETGKQLLQQHHFTFTSYTRNRCGWSPHDLCVVHLPCSESEGCDNSHGIIVREVRITDKLSTLRCTEQEVLPEVLLSSAEHLTDKFKFCHIVRPLVDWSTTNGLAAP